jgi:hypothetical protein
MLSRASPLIPSFSNKEDDDDDFLLSGAVQMLRLEDEALDHSSSNLFGSVGAPPPSSSSLPSPAYPLGLGSRSLSDTSIVHDSAGSTTPIITSSTTTHSTVKVDVNAIFSAPITEVISPHLIPISTTTAPKASGSAQFAFHSPSPVSSPVTPSSVSLETTCKKSSGGGGAKMSAAARMQLQKLKVKTPTSTTSVVDAGNQSSVPN